MRTKTSACRRAVLPDVACSPGAYHSKLTKKAICSESFRTDTVRYVPQSVKFAVERAYGMAPKSYGRSIEIGHIISLELGGSNDIANLYPQTGKGLLSYHVKDVLENKLHDLVCDGTFRLSDVRKQITRVVGRQHVLREPLELLVRPRIYLLKETDGEIPIAPLVDGDAAEVLREEGGVEPTYLERNHDILKVVRNLQ